MATQKKTARGIRWRNMPAVGGGAQFSVSVVVGSSTFKLQDAVDYGRTFSELTTVLKAGGYANQPALNIANRVMAAMLGGGYIDGQKVGPFPWKWNRISPQSVPQLPPFVTNSWQQDYATTGVGTLDWLEDGIIIDVNNTALPKPYFGLEIVRALSLTSSQFGRPGQLCWLLNKDLQYGVWGSTLNSDVKGPANPGSGAVYTNPIGAASNPANPITQIIDANGNLLVLTQYGVCGSSAPLAAANAAPGTVVIDGTAQWTVASPFGQGFRIAPRPPQTGMCWQVNLVGQQKPVLFTALGQTLDPIPDDFHTYFFEGFVAHAYRHSPELKIAGKFTAQFKLWMESLQEALQKGDREREAYGFYPDHGVMEPNPVGPIGPAWPFAPWGQ